MDVGERVFVEQNEIGDLAGFDGSAAVELSNKLSGITRGGLQGAERRQTSIDQQHEFVM